MNRTKIKEVISRDDEAAASALVELGYEDAARVVKDLRLISKTPIGEDIEGVSALALASPSPDGAVANMERVLEKTGDDALRAFMKDEDNLARLVTICGSSEYLSSILAGRRLFFEELFITSGANGAKGESGDGRALFVNKDLERFAAELAEWTVGAEDRGAFGAALRVYKKREYLRIGARDLLGLAHVREVTAELSDFASACLESAVAFCTAELTERYGRPLYKDAEGQTKEAGFAVLGMGKLGGRELNFSSDIDLIYLYTTEKGETEGVDGEAASRIHLHQFFAKLAERVTGVISKVTGDGQVFRVDLELRPDGASGDVASSLRSMEVYYESWGRTWERGAMIKARCVAGDGALGEAFTGMITPFVYRRYLDFTAIEEMKSMKEQIDAALLKRDPDAVDVKLGRGGIREIEFFCQTLQLIHGGKSAEVRTRGTLPTLRVLSERGLVTEEDARTLADAYVFLRNLEHRLQIVECRQTQAIPKGASELRRVAKMMGFADGSKADAPGLNATGLFWKEYRAVTDSVYEIYRTLFYKKGTEDDAGGVAIEKADNAATAGVRRLFADDVSDDEAAEALRRLGFTGGADSLKKFRLLKDGPNHTRLSRQARLALDRIGPLVMGEVAASPDPDMALAYMESFIAAVGARTVLYSMLAENRGLVRELARIFGTSRFLSRALVEHPGSLDLLLSTEMARAERSKDEVAEELARTLGEADGFEAKLDAIRRVRNHEVFRIGTKDVTGELPAGGLEEQMTNLAEACLESAIEVAKGELAERFGEATAEFAVIGMGKLGGSELTYGSDLDVVFVYDDGGDKTETTGPKKISNHEYFVKLAQKIINALSARTTEGVAFEVDARLRPSGSSGPLVVSRTAMLDYQREKAAVWERQAALRARFAAGDGSFGRKLVAELEEEVYKKELVAEEIDELLRIRKRMEEELANETKTSFNIKTGKGGIVDIEFTVQALQLKEGGRLPKLRCPTTMCALDALSEKGIVGDDDYEELSGAYAFLRAIETRLRVVDDRPGGALDTTDKEGIDRLARRLGYEGGKDKTVASEEFLADHMRLRDRVREIYLKTMKGLKGG